MSITVLFLVPIGMLAVAWSLCFVGCTTYSNIQFSDPYSNVVLQETSLVGYWPLNDAPGAVPPPPAPPPLPPPTNSTSAGGAFDLSQKGHTGTYTIPPAYPPGSTISQVANPAPNTGLLQLQRSMIPGDISKAGGAAIDQNLNAACVDFEGGYVSIPWPPNSADLTDFTFEAWIKPKWPASVNNFTWVLFATQTLSTGFAIYINPNNEWEFAFGNGTTLVPLKTGIAAPVGSPTDGPGTYVAVTYLNKTKALSLWINPPNPPESDLPNPPPPPPPMPVWTNPDPQNFVYVPNNPTQMATFFIGAGGTQLPVRTQPQDPNTAPLAPFQGWIQSVALYDEALDGADILSHYQNGTLTS